MGCADVVPGVSGGTVALIVGIYERLVTAISRIDREFVGFVLRGRFRDAANHIDMRFLVALTLGILTGFVGMTVIMNKLLTNPQFRMVTLAAFFGMILASTVIVARWIGIRSAKDVGSSLGFIITGALVALGVSLIPQGDAHAAEAPSLGYVFVCGAIGICAMILPGVSGAMLLLLLGVYVHLTEIPRNLLKGIDVANGLVTMGVFALGCLVTLIFFSKFLRWLLQHYQRPTMATLTGVMFGALIKVWPFQKDLTPEIEKVKYKRFVPELPATWETIHFAAIGVIVVAACLVVFIDRFQGEESGESEESGEE